MDARDKGKKLYEFYSENLFENIFFTKDIINDKWGGRENFLGIFKAHYKRLFKDPLMHQLFDMSSKETNISTDEHGMRLGLFFLAFFGDDEEYYKFRNTDNLLDKSRAAHKKASNCPLRPKKHRGKGFTID